MSVKSIQVRGNLGSAQTDRAPSRGVWHDCPWGDITEGVIPGVVFWDDFVSMPKTPGTTEGNWGSYTQFSSTGGTITAGTGQGGEAIFAVDDDDEAISIRTLATPFLISRSSKKFWFETRVKLSTIQNTTFEFFVGMMENAALSATVPIASTAGALANQNLVGFYRTESDGDAINTTYRANGVAQVTVGTGEVVPEADTYMKLGMVFEPNVDATIQDPTLSTNNKYILSFYLNGIRLSSYKQIPSSSGTDFPNDVGLGFVLAVRNAAGSSPGNATIDWVRIAQLL